HLQFLAASSSLSVAIRRSGRSSRFVRCGVLRSFLPSLRSFPSDFRIRRFAANFLLFLPIFVLNCFERLLMKPPFLPGFSNVLSALHFSVPVRAIFSGFVLRFAEVYFFRSSSLRSFFPRL